jgi:hypothetical protein
LFDPPLNQIDFGVAQRMLADERAVAAVDLPRGHEPTPGDICNLPRVPLRVIVGHQGEWRGTLRVVAHGTAIAQERPDVFFVGYLGARLRRAAERGASKAGKAEE